MVYLRCLRETSSKIKFQNRGELQLLWKPKYINSFLFISLFIIHWLKLYSFDRNKSNNLYQYKIGRRHLSACLFCKVLIGNCVVIFTNESEVPMVSKTLRSDFVVKQIEHANELAGRVLFSHLGGFTNEDVVGEFLLDEVQHGKNIDEITQTLDNPKLPKFLRNTKIDCYRKENAMKRGGNEAKVSFDEVESMSKSTYVDPETALINKENEVKNATVLDYLLEKAQLSHTQIEILSLTRKGFTPKEIAVKLDIREDAVHARKSEAVKKLSKIAKSINLK